MRPDIGHRSSPVRTGAVPIFPFFVGCARSGTTLFRAIFTSHPDMAIPDEARYFSAMIKRRRVYERGAGFDVERFLKDIFSHRSTPNWIDAREVGAALVSEPPASYADAVRSVYRLYAAKSGKRRYADKTPLNTTVIEPLAETFPEARFVHIIRDGRDVALSLMDRRFGQGNVVEAAQYWKRRVSCGRTAGKRLGAARYREVRYEALLEDPEKTVRELCDFIDLPFEPVMLQYHEREVILDPRPDDPRGIRQGRFHLPPTKGLRDWGRQMPNRDVILFELVAGDLLDELEYERGGARPSFWNRANATFQMAKASGDFFARRVLNRPKLAAR